MDKYMVSIRRTGRVWEATVFERNRGFSRPILIVVGSQTLVGRAKELALGPALYPPLASTRTSSGTREMGRG